MKSFWKLLALSLILVGTNITVACAQEIIVTQDQVPPVKPNFTNPTLNELLEYVRDNDEINAKTTINSLVDIKDGANNVNKFNEQDRLGRTILMYMVIYGRKNLMDYLLDQESDKSKIDLNLTYYDVADRKKKTALDLAKEKLKKKEKNAFEMVALLSGGKTPKSVFADPDFRELLELIRANKTEKAKNTIKKITLEDLNSTKDINGRTILMHVALNNRKDILEEIYEYAGRQKLNVDAQDNDGNTAIMLAAQHAYPDIVKIMRSQLYNIANPNIKNFATPAEFPLERAVMGVLANKGLIFNKDNYNSYVQVIKELFDFGEALDRDVQGGQDILERNASKDSNIKWASTKKAITPEMRVDIKKRKKGH